MSIEWSTKNNVTRIRGPSSSVKGGTFASLIAKIGHAYAVAECGNDPDFQPQLAEIVRKKQGPFPLPYLVGGERDVLPPTDNVHEVQIIRRRTRKHSLLVVRVRLFAFLETPTYYAVAAATRT